MLSQPIQLIWEYDALIIWQKSINCLVQWSTLLGKWVNYFMLRIPRMQQLFLKTTGKNSLHIATLAARAQPLPLSLGTATAVPRDCPVAFPTPTVRACCNENRNGYQSQMTWKTPQWMLFGVTTTYLCYSSEVIHISSYHPTSRPFRLLSHLMTLFPHHTLHSRHISRVIWIWSPGLSIKNIVYVQPGPSGKISEAYYLSYS